MKITKRQLRNIIQEERAKLFEQRSALPGPPPAEEQTGMEIEPAVEAIEKILNDLVDDGLKNADIIKLLEQIIIDINRGFVGEPS